MTRFKGFEKNWEPRFGPPVPRYIPIYIEGWGGLGGSRGL